WRRGGDRLLPARGHGRGRGRDRARGPEAGAGSDDRSRDGRGPPRRRGLRPRDRHRPGARRPDPHARLSPGQALAASTASGTSVGIVWIVRTFEASTGRNAKQPRIAEIQIVVRTPTIPDRAAPISDPTGIVPQTRK